MVLCSSPCYPHGLQSMLWGCKGSLQGCKCSSNCSVLMRGPSSPRCAPGAGCSLSDSLSQ